MQITYHKDGNMLYTTIDAQLSIRVAFLQAVVCLEGTSSFVILMWVLFHLEAPLRPPGTPYKSVILKKPLRKLLAASFRYLKCSLVDA